MNSLSNPIHHIVILCAGTVDPLNLWTRRAVSYGLKSYWQQYPEFVAELELLCGDSGVALFNAHGWSGDNTADKRRQAGAYLAERLCGANGREAYYSGYRSHQVFFHLVGHSHGGNVMNELTKRASELVEWPDNWQFASLCYLSTPFFPLLHHPSLRHFSADAKVLNVRNHHDLTQQLLASCSLHESVTDFSVMLQDIVESLDYIRLVNGWMQWVDELRLQLCQIRRRDWIIRPSQQYLTAHQSEQLLSLLKTSSEWLGTLKVILHKQPVESVFVQQAGLVLEGFQDSLSGLQLMLAEHGQHKIALVQLFQMMQPLLRQGVALFSLEGVMADYSVASVLRTLFVRQLENYQLTQNDPAVVYPYQRVRIEHVDLTELDPVSAFVTADFSAWLAEFRGKLDTFCQHPSNSGLAELSLLLALTDSTASGVIKEVYQLWRRSQRWATVIFQPLLLPFLCWHPLYKTLRSLHRYTSEQFRPLLLLIGQWLHQPPPLQPGPEHLKSLLLHSHSMSRMQLYPVVRNWFLQGFGANHRE